jgi:hypothetical protein
VGERGEPTAVARGARVVSDLKPGDLCVVLPPPPGEYYHPAAGRVIGRHVVLLRVSPMESTKYAPYWLTTNTQDIDPLMNISHKILEKLPPPLSYEELEGEELDRLFEESMRKIEERLT